LLVLSSWSKIRKEEAMINQEQIRGAWDGIAEGYDEFVTPLMLPLWEQILRRVDISSGMRLLDVAAGTGALSLPAARRRAQVVATDIAPGMIERLIRRARNEGLSNIEGKVMDGLSLELGDNTFDVAASAFGVTIFPDLKRGLGEMVRVTKPLGKVLIVALGSPQKAEFFGFFLGALKATVPGFTGPPTDPPPMQFQVADPEKFRQALSDSGLTDIMVDTVTIGMEFQSGAHLWGLLMSSNPMGPQLVINLTDEQRATVKEVLDRMLRERSGGKGSAILNLEVNIGIGTKPKTERRS
jgi:ubiquinone/menaquinone biosynthesis C-methylase UbiE